MLLIVGILGTVVALFVLCTGFWMWARGSKKRHAAQLLRDNAGGPDLTTLVGAANELGDAIDGMNSEAVAGAVRNYYKQREEAQQQQKELKSQLLVANMNNWLVD